MSIIMGTYQSFDINCPYCDTPNEIDDIDFSVTIDNTNITRCVDECAFYHTCEECCEIFIVNPEANIKVRKK